MQVWNCKCNSQSCLSFLPKAQMNRAEMDFIPIHQFDAIIWHALVVDPRAATAVLIVDSITAVFQN